MGTFHALCAFFLRKYGRLVGLDGNFTICDEDEGCVVYFLGLTAPLREDSKKIVSTLLKAYNGFLEEKKLSLKEGTVLSMISKAKAKAQTSSDFFAKIKRQSQNAKKPQATVVPPNDVEFLVAEIYEMYERTLRRNNSLDFDDLLLFGVRLFTEHRQIVDWCKHVLVDEL
jgi:DNA helicase-2/ATP-dependent DNA helicase PcrA